MTDRLAAEAEADAQGHTAADAGITTQAAPGGGAHRLATRASAFGGGVAAAGLGLGALAAAVLLLWIASPFPDSGLDGALHVSAAMWLLAQGADLVRTQTLSGAPAPIGVTPLLLSALPAWLLYRGAASAAAPHTDDDGDDGDDGDDAVGGDGEVDVDVDLRAVAVAAGWLLCGYLTVVAVVVTYASHGLVHVDAGSAALYVPVFAVLAVAAGTWTGAGRPGLGDRLPYGADAAVALRAAGIAVGVLVGGGALLGGASIAWHSDAVGRTFVQLSGPMAGRIAVLAVALALLPNMAVWAVSYALGPGFAVGVGSVVAPAGVSAHPALPGFPLLAALPSTGGPSTAGWATLALPALAGAFAGWSVGRACSTWTIRRTALTSLATALTCATALAALAAWAGGPLGTATLAHFGPTPWTTGAAALSWFILTTPPTALLLHHLRHHLPPHSRRSARRAWAALSALRPADGPGAARGGPGPADALALANAVGVVGGADPTRASGAEIPKPGDARDPAAPPQPAEPRAAADAPNPGADREAPDAPAGADADASPGAEAAGGPRVAKPAAGAEVPERADGREAAVPKPVDAREATEGAEADGGPGAAKSAAGAEVAEPVEGREVTGFPGSVAGAEVPGSAEASDVVPDTESTADGRLGRWLPDHPPAAPDDGLGINPPDFDPLPWPTPPVPPPMPLTPPPPPISPPPPESEPSPPAPPSL
ncbi:DUF6350 family protein [Streptomyces sp. NPDC051976]|uniref:cell division protein PerM n=1 Tax=Streptomyces sp. NPDC051976 TaxID=3154947 RepID=UPI00343AC4CE